jgi:hypothetical protein
MPPRYIRHLTLDTGDQRDSYRDEVGDAIVEMLGPLLQRVAAGERVEIPGDVEPRCTISGATGRGRALLVTVWGPPYDERGIRAPGGLPLVMFGVAPSSLASATLWREWIGTERDDRTPTAPWCAVRIQPGIAVYPSAAGWLGDFERCCAWAWLEGGS